MHVTQDVQPDAKAAFSSVTKYLHAIYILFLPEVLSPTTAEHPFRHTEDSRFTN